MGLDGIELVIRVEESFGIKIADEEASRCETVGQLYEVVLKKISTPDQNKCLTAIMFYKIREIFVAYGNCLRKAVRPDARLEDLVPKKTRRKFWNRISNHSGMELPSLAYPLWFKWLIFAASAVAFVAMGIIWNFPVSAFATLTGAMIFCKFIFTPLATVLRPATVGELAQIMVRDNIGKISTKANSISKDDVWNCLIEIVADETGNDKSHIKYDSRFVADLNMG